LRAALFMFLDVPVFPLGPASDVKPTYSPKAYDHYPKTSMLSGIIPV
jgi:hypothetical protein